MRNSKLFFGLMLCVCVGDTLSHPLQGGSKRSRSKLFQLEVIHLNDFHARFEETSVTSGECKDHKDGTCIGGIARLSTVLNQLRTNKSSNVIFLNAGDNFQGTLWYNLFHHNVTSTFLNMLKFDAYTLGNHEFDDGVAGLVPFIKAIKAPMSLSNINDSAEPTMQNTYKKSVVLERGGRRIGVVGVIIRSTDKLSNTGKLKFTDEVEAVNKEAARLASQEKCNIIIVLSHCGLDVDMIIAKNAESHIGLIVGGHSHSLLYTGIPPSHNADGKPDKPKAEYPVKVTRQDGGTVLIVQASSYTKYLGDIKITYDEKGRVVKWEGKPIFLSNKVVPDPKMLELMSPWKKSVDALGNKILGYSKSNLDSSKCSYAECSLGNLIADAFVHHYVKHNPEPQYWTYAAIAINNPGGIRTSIPAGNISLKMVVAAQPFENTVDVGELQGKYIREMLEFAATSKTNSHTPTSFLQLAGINVYYDLNKPEMKRVTKLLVQCQKCKKPQFEAHDEQKMYRIIMPSFLARVENEYNRFLKHLVKHQVGPIDQHVISDYLAQKSPIDVKEEGRINVVGEKIAKQLKTNPGDTKKQREFSSDYEYEDGAILLSDCSS